MTAPKPDDDTFVGDAPPTDGPSQTDPPADPPADPPGDDAAPPDLGDAGKRALDAMKAKWKAETAARKKAEADLAAAQDAKAGDDQAAALAKAQREAEVAATAKANGRILRSEVRAAATGKLADPKDALIFLDLEQFEVGTDGDVDTDEIAAAIDGLLTARPYLAAATVKRFQGTGDNGAAGRNDGKTQVTEAQLLTMSPDAIDKARREGRLKTLLGG